MNRASRVLRMVSPPPLVVEDGQESMRKLALAPLTFLSLGGSAFHLASILASAVAFLEGYGGADLETDVRLVQKQSGEIVAHTELVLVPYALRKEPAPAPPIHQPAPQSSAHVPQPIISRRLSLSQVVAEAAPRRFSEKEASQLRRFRDSFRSSSSTVPDCAANELLCTTDSVEVAKAVLRLSSEVGLTIPRATLMELVKRMRHVEPSLAGHVYREFALEVNLEALRESSLVSPPSAPLLTSQLPRKRKQSKLERLRCSPTPK